MMGVVLWIIVVLIGIVVATIGMVLLAPVQVKVDWGSSGTQFRIHLLCVELVYDKSAGIMDLRLFGVTIIHKITTKKKKAKIKKKRTMGNMWEVWREHPNTIKKWLKQTVLLIYRVIRALRIDCIKINAVIATTDPYWTSVIYGYAEAVGWGLRMIPRVQINLNPDFKTDRPKGDITLAVTYRMYRLTWAVMRFLWAVPKRDSVRMIRRLRESSKEVECSKEP